MSWRSLKVDVRSVDEISDFGPYDAVVLGSGVYDGSWTTEATDLVRRHTAVLARKPVWLFSVDHSATGIQLLSA